MDMYQKRKMRAEKKKNEDNESFSKTSINWFPGHMKKTKDMIAENLKLVDVVIELLDARVPISSKNPDIDKIINNKPKLIVVNKSDLADDNETKKWKEYFKSNNQNALFVNSLKSIDKNIVIKQVKELIADKLQKEKEQGRKERTLRVMIVGIPNVGKSTFINQLVKKKIAEVGNKPGVTRGKQWIRIDNDIELLDMPGVLWPKFEDQLVAQKLACLGSINNDILHFYDLSLFLISYLKAKEKYKKMIEERFKIEINDTMKDTEIFEEIGRKRGFVVKGKEIDIKRTANTLIDEFKNGKIGKISLDCLEDFE